MAKHLFSLLLLLLVPAVSSAQWSQIGADIDGEAEDDVSGTSLAFASGGSLLAIGAYYNDNAAGDDAGHVRTYSDALFRDGFESGGTGGWSTVIP